MNSTKERLHEIANLDLSQSERAQLRCRLARELEEAGNYEAAREAMGELWQEVGARPEVSGLDQETAANVLLRVGALTGWLGSAKQIEGAQETAKNLISESSRIFETTEKRNKVAEAQTDLAVCYWREGAFDNARVILQEALLQVAEADIELRAVTLVRKGLVESSAKRLIDALRIYDDSALLIEKSANHLIKGKFHVGLANVLNQLRTVQDHVDYTDRALIEYAAASHHFEQAGHARYQACVENNLGYLFRIIGKFSKAHEHLDRAQALFTSLRDSVHLAQVDETRAGVLLGEGRIVEAEKTVCRAVRTLERGDEHSLLAQALTTHGIALTHLQHVRQARSALERAVDVAELAGDAESAGQAALTMVEQLGLHLSHDDVVAIMKRAFTLLERTQDMTTLRRLTTCVFRALFLMHVIAEPPDWLAFSVRQAVLNYEGHLIELALKESGGRVTRAARLLGLPGHQSLLHILNTRHENLLDSRTPVKPRRRGIIGHRDTA